MAVMPSGGPHARQAATDRWGKVSEEQVRTIIRLAGITGALALAACSGNDASMSDEFRKDLELASSTSPITLASSEAAAQVVSPIERTQPAPRRVANSQRVARHVPAPRSTPAPVEAEVADVSEEIEEAPVYVAEAPVEEAPLPSPRPQPVASVGVGRGSGDDGIGDRGIGAGDIIAVVLRGGHGGIDECDPRVDGRRGRVHTAVNNRIPIIGTFPGGGRIQGTFPSGRLTASLPGRGRVRF